MFQVKETTVRTWIFRGFLKAHKFGKFFRVSESDLRAFIEAGKPK